MTTKIIKIDSKIISNLKCEHDLEIIEEEILSDENIKIIAKCCICGKKYYYNLESQNKLF